MRRSEAFPSKYIGKDDIGTGITLTIDSVVMEEIESDDTVKLKAVINWRERDAKQWIVNAGNWMTIEDVYGGESNDWTGKRVELFIDPTVMFGGKRVGGVRVRVPTSGQAPAPATTQTDTPQSQTVVAAILGCEVKDGWFIFDTPGGKFGTADKAVGETVQSFGETLVSLTYHLTPQGKKVIDAGAPVEGGDDDSDIPFTARAYDGSIGEC